MPETETPTKSLAESLDRWKKRAPNLLTLSRVLLSGAFVAVLAGVDVRGASLKPDAIERLELLLDDSVPLLIVATAIFIVGALTDALDGILARRWNAVSRLGRVMDPVADKLLVLGAFVVLAGPGFTVIWGAEESRFQVSGVMPWMVWVLLGRELLVTSIRGVYESEGVDFSAGPAGKIKMVLQSIAVPIILLIVALGAPVPGSTGQTVVVSIAWAVTIVTAWSGLPYIARAIIASKQLAAQPRSAEQARLLRKKIDRVEIPTTNTRRRPGRRANKKRKSR